MSQAQIGNLQVALGINTAQFSAGLAQAQGSLARFGSTLKTFAAAAGATLTLGAVGMAIKANIDHMDELGKAAQKIGIPVEELSKLEYAAKLADVSLDDLTSTMAKFSKNISEIAGGGQNDAGQALQAIGLSAVDAQGKLIPTTALLEDIADEFSVMKDSAAKTALAIALFGKSGAAMIPLLNGGRQAIRSAGVELEQFGGVVTAEAAARAEEYNDNLTKLQTAFNSLLQEALIPIIPKLTELTTNLLELIKVGSPLRQFITDAATWFEEWGPSLSNTKREIEGIAEALRYLGVLDPKPLEINIPGADLAPPAPEKPKQTKDAPILPDLSAAKKAADEAARALERLKDEGQSVWEDTRTPLENYQLGLRNLNDLLQQGVIDHDTYSRAIQSLQAEFMAADVTFQQIGEDWQTLSEQLATSMQETLGQTIEGLADSMSSIFGVIVSGTGSVKDAFADMGRSVAQTLEQLAAQLLKSSIITLLKYLPGLLAGGGGAGINFGGMTFGGLYADGGNLGSGKWGIAGENGPEIIHGPANITPMDKGAGSSNVNVTVINNSSASVNTRKNTMGDLEIMVEDIMADKAARGGNKFDAALQRGYGLKRSGR